MANMLRKADIVRVLQEANVEFDPEATIVQLRPLYDEVVNRAAQNPPDANPVELPEARVNQNPPDAQQLQRGEQQHLANANANWAEQMQREEEELDRQLAIARKKRELIQLQQDLNELDSRKIDLHVLDAMMSKFDGSDVQDVSKWIADLENVFAVFRYSERDKLVAARHLMSGYAKRYTDVIRVRSYNELKAELIKEFRRAFTVQDVLKQLRSRVIKSDETPRQYVIEMQYIASRADVAETDLIDIIIDGLNDRSSLISMLYSATTIDQLKVLMERYEKKRRATVSVPMPVKMQTVVSGSTGAVPKQSTSFGLTNTSASVNANTPVDLATVRCYNCFAFGHYQSACPAPKRPPNSCFICAEVGHTRHNCPKKKKPSDAPAATAATVAAAVNQRDDWNEDWDEEAEVRRLAAQLKHHNLSR